jgi:amino acid adenylation domain-containing protein
MKSTENIAAIYPLSPTQSGLLFYLLNANKGDLSYREQLKFTVDKTLCLANLKQAWQHVVNRHPVLRSIYSWQDKSQPFQIVLKHAPLHWQEHDLSHLNYDDCRQCIKELSLRARQYELQLDQQPPLQIDYFKLPDGSAELVFSFTHLQLDGWSMALISNEVEAILHQLLTADPLALPPAGDYKEYVKWLLARDHAASLQYWQQQLQDCDPAPPLHLKQQATQSNSSNHEQTVLRQQINVENSQKIQLFCRQNGMTLNAFMLGVFGYLNNLASDQTHSIIGAVVSGRPAEIDSIERTAGFFSNAVPTAIKSVPGLSFINWLQQLQQQLAEGREHAFVSLEQIKAGINIAVTEPLFSTLFIFQNYPKKIITGDNNRSVVMQQQQGVEQSHYPLTLYISVKDTISIWASYDNLHYDHTEVQLLLNYYHELMLLCMTQATTPLSELNLLTDARREQLERIAKGPCKPELIQQHLSSQLHQLTTASDRLALVDGKRQFSYLQLARYVETLRKNLQAQNIGPGQRVALRLTRSAEFIIASLACLQAGASYVPIDPAMPLERQQFILQDAAVVLIISESSTEADQVPVWSTDSLLDGPLSAAPSSEHTFDNQLEAYVIYTSGSTGTPKGVAVSRGALCHYALSAAQYYHLQPSDHALQFASVSFDTAIEEIYPTLFSQASLVIRDDAVLGSAASFNQFLQQQQISILNLPTAYWMHLVTMLEEEQVKLSPQIRSVIIGGEEALPGVLKKWQQYCLQYLLNPALYNTYGPTETTVITSRTELSQYRVNNTALPIGRAIDNSALYIVNEHLQLLSPGCVGEIAISGPGLALGYLNQIALTAEKFVQLPQAGKAYLSGDLGYYQDDQLFYLGRKDFQVKIRGYRVELGEIEQLLSTHPDISECVVASFTNEDNTRQLAAYYVATVPLSHLQIRQFLAAVLPDYMLPSASVQLNQLPKTLTGKYDRKHLPIPQFELTQVSCFSDPYQDLLAQIWLKLLGDQPLTTESHFFRLGGHSILVTKLIAEVRKNLQLNLSFTEVFQQPELAKLAALLQQKQAQEQQAFTLPAIKPYPPQRDIPLSFQQERVWFLQQLQPGNTAYNFQLTFWLKGPLQPEILAQSLTEIVARQHLWHTSFHQQDGIPFQRIGKPFDVELQLESLMHLNAQDKKTYAQSLLDELSQTAFDVSQLPLIRWKLLQLDTDYYQLIQVEHHLVHDGWSVGLFLKELQSIYQAKLAGTAHALPALHISYADFCLWQREVLAGPYFSQMEQYWLTQLADCPTQLALPYDYARPAVPSFRGDSEMFHLPDALYSQLRQFSKQQGYTLYMTMLAAYYVMLSRYSQQTDICVGAGAASRSLPELQPIIGMMVNSIVLRTDLSGNPNFLQLLDRVKTTCLGGYSHQDMPFEQLVKKLCPSRTGHANPLFQTMFSFHDAEVPDLNFGGLEVTAQVKTNKSAKLDLNIIVAPQAEQRVGKLSTRPAYAVVTWEYSTELFSRKTILDMIDTYLQLLDNLTKQPEQPISQLSAVSPESMQEQLFALNNTAQPLPDASIPALFDQQVLQHSDRVAVVCPAAGDITYLQLQQRSLQLATYLQQHNVEQGQIVGLALPAGMELYAAMLACLRLGASYMPLDLTAGEHRLSAMYNDLQLQSRPIILAQQPLSAHCPASIRVLPLPAPTAQAIACFDHSRALQQAYVLYTSGTTGRPKGVCVPQQAVIRLVKNNQFLTITEQDRLLQHSSVYFDASILEIWGALLNGASLIVPAQTKLTLDALEHTLKQHRISILWLTAGLFHAFADYFTGRPLHNLHTLLAGGDVLSMEKVRTVLLHYPHLTLINGYGPTENTTFSYCYPMRADTLSQWQHLASVPLGYAISNSRGYILDQQQQLLPYGATGELYLAGLGLATEYLGLDGPTADNFIELTLGEGDCKRTERLYRTGDLVRYSQDGLLCFVGRRDSQIKIRGFRVEILEIEEILRQHPQVQQAAVVVDDDPQLGKTLFAFVSTDDNISSAELMRYCQQTLQPFQQPASISLLPQLPLTAVGKVNKTALLNQRTTELPVDETQVPATETEIRLQQIWSQVLGKTKITVQQNFFSLGGHSLVAVKVIADIHQHFGVRLSLLDFFHRPTIAALAVLIEQQPIAATAELVSPLSATSSNAEELENLSDEELDAMLAVLAEQD